MTRYPDNVDTGGTGASATLPDVIDNVSPVSAIVVNRLRNAILAIENELGINPSERFGTVRDRLDCLEFGPCGSGGGGSLSTILQDGVTVMNNVEALNIIGANVTDAGDHQADVNFSTFMLLDGSRAATANWDLGGNRITNLADPINPQDAVTMAYVDALFSDGYAPVLETLTVSADGQTVFTLSQVPELPGAVAFFAEGIKQEFGVDYTVSGANIHYTGAEPLLTTDTIDVIYYVLSSGFPGGGIHQTLAQTLFYGNVTGGEDIVVSVTDAITSENPAVPVSVIGDLSITGKLTVGGLIDPTGLVLDTQGSTPGGVPAANKGTIWYRASDEHMVYTTDAGLVIDLTTGIVPTLAEVLDAGNTTDGYDIIMSNGSIITATTGTGATDGSDVDILAGPATGTGAGGAVNINGGSAAAGAGGNVVIYGGDGGTEGDVLVGAAGNTVFSVIGDVLGTITFDKDVAPIINQTAPTSGAGSDFRIDVQDATTTGTGGDFIVNAGSGAGVSQGGAIDLNAGGTGTGSGGIVSITGGDGTINGGTITLESGAAATGGDLELFAGDSAAGTGGNVIVKTQGNTIGDIQFLLDANTVAEFLGSALGTFRFGRATTPVINVEQNTSGAGAAFTITSQKGGSGGVNDGGGLFLNGGNASDLGGDGGAVEISGGTGTNTGIIALHTNIIEIDENTVDIRSVTDGSVNADSGSFAIHSGNITDAGNSGSVIFNSGSSAGGDSGNLDLYTGGASTSGSIQAYTGDGYTDSGDIDIYTGDGYTSSGDIDIVTGDATYGTAGHLHLTAGDSLSGNQSDIYIASGRVLTGTDRNLVNIYGGDGYSNGSTINIIAGAGYWGSGGTLNLYGGSGSTSSVHADDLGPGDGGSVLVSGGGCISGTCGDASLGGGVTAHGTGGNVYINGGFTHDGPSAGSVYISGGVDYGGNDDGYVIFSMADEEVGRFGRDPSALVCSLQVPIKLKEVANPGRPATGYAYLYLSSTDGHLWINKDDGSARDLET